MEFKFLSGLFQNGKPRPSAAIEHVTSGTLTTTGAQTSVFDQNRGGWDIDRAVNEGLERVIWIFRCVDAISTNFAGLTLNGRKGDPIDGEKYDLDEEIFRLLNRRPNTYETSIQWKYRLASQLLLSKRGAFIEKEMKGNQIVALHLLQPHMVEPIPDPRTFVSGYRLKKSGGAGEDKVDANRIIWVRTRPHPLDPYSQITPLSAAGIVAETDFLARLFNRNFLMNDGRPTTLVTVAGELDPEDAEEIKNRFSGGPQYAGRTTVLEADNVTVADLSSNPRDVQWLEAIQGSKQELMLAFGVPESVLGNASGRTFDNADAEREGFWKDTMQPFANGIARCLDELTGDLDDDNYVSCYYDNIDVLKRQERAAHDKLLDEWQKGAITLDEYLEGTGRKKLNIPGSDAHFLANGLIIVDPSKYEEVKAIPQIVPPAPGGELPGMPGSDPSMDPNATTNGQDPNSDASLASRMQAFLQGNSKRLAITRFPESKDTPTVLEGEVVSQGKADPRAEVRGALEGQVQAALTIWSSLQEDVLPTRLGHAKALMHTRHWVGEAKKQGGYNARVGDKALNTGYVVQTQRWQDEVVKSLRPVLSAAIKREMKRSVNDMDSGGFIKLMDRHGLTATQKGPATSRVYGSASGAAGVADTILNELMDLASKAAARQSQRVADRIADMDANGSTLKQIQQEVKRMIGERSSWRRGLSVFLSGAALEAAQESAWAKAGVLVEKTWNTQGDEHVRPTHVKVDGTTIANGAKFQVGKYHMSRPNDITAGPEETANCRCWLDWDLNDTYAQEYDDYV